MAGRGYMRFVGGTGGAVLMAAAVCLACDEGQSRPAGPRGPSGPPVACTTIGCEDGLVVELRPTSGWPAGEYRFRIRTDSFEVTCRGSLPLPSCTGAGEPAPAVTCDREGLVQVVESGCALPADAQAFPGLRLDSKLRPRQLELVVTRNAKIVGRVDIIPSFERVQPNGLGCPPTCESARAALDLRF